MLLEAFKYIINAHKLHNLVCKGEFKAMIINTAVRKELTFGIILLFFGICIMPLSTSTSVVLNENTLYVGGSGPGNYSSIQNAINDANPDDTIFVYDDSSPYYENLVIDKAINLVGENKNSTIIDGDEIDHVVYITGDCATVSSFTIQNGGSSGMGVLVRGGLYNAIINNILINNRQSIYLKESSYNVISLNSCSDNDHQGITLDALSSEYNKVTKNHIFNNSVGVTVIETSNNIIAENVIHDVGVGVNMYPNCNNNSLYKNTIFDCGDGFSLGDASNNNYILDNTIYDNSCNGIEMMDDSSFNVISRNSIDNCGMYGIILVRHCTNNVIIENTISNSGFSGSNSCGMSIRSSNNSIYHNNFVDNKRQAWDEAINQWDDGYPSGGNFWSDYTGVDADEDGIGDTPYGIAGGENQDTYPLMEFFIAENISDLNCEGSLEWTGVKPGSTVEGSFHIMNIGGPATMLDWEIAEYPEWGNWTFTPASGLDLTPGDGAVTVDVVVVAPGDSQAEFNGFIKIVNLEDATDFCLIQVSLSFYNEPDPEPDLDCDGDLTFTDVKPGSTVEGSITVSNIGDSGSMLDWEISEYPGWGEWTFSPSSGTDLKPEDPSVTIDVQIIVPDLESTEFNGNITLENKDDSSDSCTISVKIITPKQKTTFRSFLLELLERLFQRLPGSLLQILKNT